MFFVAESLSEITTCGDEFERAPRLLPDWPQAGLRSKRVVQGGGVAAFMERSAGYEVGGRPVHPAVLDRRYRRQVQTGEKGQLEAFVHRCSARWRACACSAWTSIHHAGTPRLHRLSHRSGTDQGLSRHRAASSLEIIAWRTSTSSNRGTRSLRRRGARRRATRTATAVGSGERTAGPATRSAMPSSCSASCIRRHYQSAATSRGFPTLSPAMFSTPSAPAGRQRADPSGTRRRESKASSARHTQRDGTPEFGAGDYYVVLDAVNGTDGLSADQLELDSASRVLRPP